MYQVGNRGGTKWYGYGPDANTTPTISIDTTTTGPCNSGGSLKVVSNGNTQWGDGVGVNFEPDDANKKKPTWDGSAYTGVGFWAKCSTEVQFAYMKVVDAANDADIVNPTCTYASGQTPQCNQYGIKNVAIEKDWTYYQLYFDELLQDPKTAPPYGTGVDPKKLTAVQVQMNTPYDPNGGNPTARPYTCWIDDVHFLKTASPKPTQLACSGYKVSGNKIQDCSGNTKVFRGVARPSLEWDGAGWNINPADMARIKGWKANLIRFSLNQDYWLNKYKGIYPQVVQRAVKWAEVAGLDVILDLHWLDDTVATSHNQQQMADSTSTTFWTQVATAFKGDSHVMFELYNEPYSISATQWHSTYDTLYKAVRAAGAQQIVILGGLDWAYDLSQVLPAQALSSSYTNVAYNTHPYGNKSPSSDWDSKFGKFAATYPLFATEFGTYDCTGGSGGWTTQLINYFESKGMSWTAWAWYEAPNTCQFPALISDYSGAVLNGAGSNADAAKTGLAKNP